MVVTIPFPPLTVFRARSIFGSNAVISQIDKYYIYDFVKMIKNSTTSPGVVGGLERGVFYFDLVHPVLGGHAGHVQAACQRC